MTADMGCVDIWLFPFETMDEALRRRCLPLLDAGELAQLGRFAIERPRNQYLVARAMVRLVLSHHSGRSPQSLSFTKDDFGRPWLAAPDDALGLYFSLSHTDGLVGLAVSATRLVGLDVEDIHRSTNFLGIAQSYFAASEWAGLNELSGGARRDRFFDLWTTKEAYIKACGKGLQIALDQFAVDVTDSSARLIRSDDPAHALDDWQFFRSQPTPRHKLAVAALFNPRAALACRTHWLAPLLQPS